MAPAAMLRPDSLRPLPRLTPTLEMAREAWPGTRIKKQAVMAASCFAEPAHGSPPKIELETYTLHEALPIHAADTIAKEFVELQEGKGMLAIAVSRSDVDALTRAAAADTAEMIGVP